MFQIPVPLLVPVCGSGVSFLVPILGPFLVPKIGTKNCPFNCFYIRRFKKWGLFLEPKMDPKLAPKIETAGPNLGNFWTKNGPKIGTENVPPDIGKNENYRRPNIGIWGTKIDYYFHPQKETPAPPSLSPESVNAKLIHFFWFASTMMASLRCLTTASGVVAAAVEKFATDAQCKQAWLR